MTPGRLSLALLSLALAMLGGCSTYSIQQTALVPAAITPAAPMRDPGLELAALGSYVTGAREHDFMRSSSLWVARGHALGTLEYSGRVAGVRVTGFSAPSRGAFRGPGETLPNPRGNVLGGGAGVTLRALGTEPHQRLHFAIESALVVSPSYVRSTCDLECSDESTAQDYVDRSFAFMHTVSVHYRRDLSAALTAVGTFALQTTVKNQEHLENQRLSGRSTTELGAPHPLLDLGLEVHPSKWLDVAPLVGFISPPSALLFLPSVSLIVRFHVPQDLRAEEARPAERAASRSRNEEQASLGIAMH